VNIVTITTERINNLKTTTKRKIDNKVIKIFNMTTFNVNLPQGLENQLNYLETISKRPKSFFIQEALIRYLEEIEDIRDALERSQSEGKTYTTEELLKELGINV